MRCLRGPCSLLLLFAISGLAAFAQQTAKPAPTPTDANPIVHVLGLEGIKHNLHGKLSIGEDGLKFTTPATNSQIAIASIEDVFTDQDSRQTGGTALTVAKMAVPYGGGRVLSLFTHEKFDSLTVQYRDANGGLHGAIFTMPAGQAVSAKKELVALGVKTSTPVVETPAADAAKKEKK